MKKAISLVLVFSMLLLSANMFAQGRKGADLIIQKKNGAQVRGELIAVKQNSLLMLERDSGADVTIPINDIQVIQIVKKSQLFLGVLAGGLIAGAFGTIVEGSREPYKPSGSYTGPYPEFYYGIRGAFDDMFSGLGIAIGVLIGAIVGGIAGAAAGTDKKIQTRGRSDSAIQEILKELSKKARIKNAQ
jgi:hypothetical protein